MLSGELELVPIFELTVKELFEFILYVAPKPIVGSVFVGFTFAPSILPQENQTTC